LLKNIPVSVDRAPLTEEEFILQVAEITTKEIAKIALERQKLQLKMTNDLLRRSAIPPRYINASLEHGLNEQAHAYKESQAFVTDFPARLKTGSGMVLWGDVGTGKTYLACAIANALLSQLRPVLYCTVQEAVALIKSCWTKSTSGLSEYDVYLRFGESELLVIDEVGVQTGSDFERTVLTTITDIRSRNCLPTVIVSNLELEKIYNLLGERMFDRLVGYGANVIHMAGRSMRSTMTRG